MSFFLIFNPIGAILYYIAHFFFLTKFRNLVDNEEIDVNVRDKWDSTPL